MSNFTFNRVKTTGFDRNLVVRALLLAVLCVLALLSASTVPGVEGRYVESAAQTASTTYLPIFFKTLALSDSPVYGVNFISSPEDPADAQQYLNGLLTGAKFNRWPMYWNSVEKSAGSLNWSLVDPVVRSDLNHGLEINAILLGTPSFYAADTGLASDATRPEQNGPFQMLAAQAATPSGLYAPIFSDDSDVPGPGKQINSANVWARYVFRAVDRYRPGGVLAKAENWQAGKGIRHWEMWNEPDLKWFWDSSLADYARLLEVGYLAAKQADPNAQVLFGALANNSEWLTYYDEVLDIYDNDSLAKSNRYFHDILATHSYFYAWQSWYHVYRASTTMKAHGLDKLIWLNENGVPAWNDYPGPTWDPESALRATMEEQANFVIQSAFYATFAGADAIFHFQLYDGCGNQPQGSDFPPHEGELCNVLDVCAGDANGLFRNPTDAACFTQHPKPETARPNLAAFQVLTKYLVDVQPLWRLRPGSNDPNNGPQEWIAFDRPATHERIVGMWARFGSNQVAKLPALADHALLILPDGSQSFIFPNNGTYSVVLPAATNQNAPWDPTLYAIGGRPAIVIESYQGSPN